MRFIKRKNLREGEELLYTPQLHWVYTIKHLILSLPFFILLLILWLTADASVYASTIGDFEIALTYQALLRVLFFAGILIVLVIFICRIFIYLSTEYGLTTKRLIIKKGVFRLVIAEIPTDRIESICCIQGLLGRICHYGNIYIGGVGGMKPVFFMVARPYALRRRIVDVIERNKAITIVQGDMPKKTVKEKPVVKQNPIYRYGTFIRMLPGSET